MLDTFHWRVPSYKTYTRQYVDMPVISGDVDETTKHALDDMATSGMASSRSEAVNIAVTKGLEQLGYHGSKRRQTGLREIIQHAYVGSLWTVIALVGLTWLGPLELRLLVIGILPIPAIFWAMDKTLARIEPRATRALIAAIGGDSS